MTENQYAVVKILRSVSGECKSIFDEYRVSFDEKKTLCRCLLIFTQIWTDLYPSGAINATGEYAAHVLCI